MTKSTMGQSASNPPEPISILFVCLGNICRSTMAEAVFNHLTRTQNSAIPSSAAFTSTKSAIPSKLQFITDSAGTGAYHEGADPDPRTMLALDNHDISGYTHSARKLRADDFQEFDYILGMDDDNVHDIKAVRRRVASKSKSEDGLAKVFLFGDFGGRKGEEVVDPYYGADQGFELAFEQMGRFSRGLVEFLEKEQRGKRGGGS